MRVSHLNMARWGSSWVLHTYIYIYIYHSCYKVIDVQYMYIYANHRLWLSEQRNLGIRRNFRLKNGCGVNVKGNIKTPNWNLISYCWRSSGMNITTFLTPPRKITSRIELRMRNPRKINIRYVISCYTVNRDQCRLHMIVLHPWRIPSLITSKIKLNWFAATLKNLWYIYWSVTIHCPHISWIISWTV